MKKRSMTLTQLDPRKAGEEAQIIVINFPGVDSEHKETYQKMRRQLYQKLRSNQNSNLNLKKRVRKTFVTYTTFFAIWQSVWTNQLGITGLSPEQNQVQDN